MKMMRIAEALFLGETCKVVHSFFVTLNSFSPSDNKFASCSDDGLVKVWDFYRCAEERELKGWYINWSNKFTSSDEVS